MATVTLGRLTSFTAPLPAANRSELGWMAENSVASARIAASRMAASVLEVEMALTVADAAAAAGEGDEEEVARLQAIAASQVEAAADSSAAELKLDIEWNGVVSPASVSVPRSASCIEWMSSWSRDARSDHA